MNHDNERTEPVVCPVCGAQRSEPVVTGSDHLVGHAGSFTLCTCARCGLLYLNPRPADIMRFYEGDYVPHQAWPRSPLAWLRRWFPRRPRPRARRLTHLAGGSGRMLDVGCGRGEWMAELAQVGWDVYGVDPFEPIAHVAQERFPQRVTCATLEAAHFPDAHFDLITLLDVIEHVPDPVATLREARRILRPGGLLLLQTPRWGCLESHFFGRLWGGLDCPRHLCIFSDSTLGAAVQRAGMRGTVIPSLVSSHWQWILSCRFWSYERFGARVAHTVYWALAQRVPRYLLAPFFAVLDRIGQGSILTMIARREADSSVQACVEE